MRAGEKGYTLIEFAVAISLIALISLSGTTITFNSFQTAKLNNDHLTAVSDGENAAFWISRDANMADMVIADNLTSPAFLNLKWTDWGYGTENVYHSVTYSIENISNGVGLLKRRHQDSNGTDLSTLIASYVYYNQADPSGTTRVTYQSPYINLKVANRFGAAIQAREYNICPRPNFGS